MNARLRYFSKDLAKQGAVKGCFIFRTCLHTLVCMLLFAAPVHICGQDDLYMREMALQMPKVFINPGESLYSGTRRYFHGIPGVERATGGRLLVTCMGGGLREGGDSSTENYVMLFTSGDSGLTWSGLKMVVDMPADPVRLSNSCLWMDPLGRLWFFWAQAYKPARHSGVWAMVTGNPDDPDPDWSEPRRLCEGMMMNKPVVLSNGDWLLTSDIGKTENSCQVVISKDQGESFTLLGAANVPDPEDRSANEHMIVEKKDGSLWMLVRTNYGMGESNSHDGGITWSPVAPADIKHAVSRFHIRRLISGNLLLVKHGPLDRQTQRIQLTAYISTDDGVTWQGGLLLDERFVSYPDARQAADGRIWLVYDHGRYAGTDREILMAVFTEADAMAGVPSEDTRLKVLVNKAVDPVPDGYALYNDFGNCQKIQWTDPLKQSFTDRVPDPDTTILNPGAQAGKFIASYDGWSHIHFNFPEYLDLTIQDTFRLKLYYRGSDADTSLCKVKLILRNNGDYASQYASETVLAEANAWHGYSFVFQDANLRGDYNQLWLFVSSPVVPGPAGGDGFYIDDLTGPPLRIDIDSCDILTSRSGDSVIIDIASAGRPLAPVSYPVYSGVIYPVFSLLRNGWEEVAIVDVTNDSSAFFLHIEPGVGISPRDRLSLSYMLGNIEDINGYVLPYFSGRPVLNRVPMEFFHLRFIITDTETGDKIPDVSVYADTLGGMSNLIGEVLFEVKPGHYDYSIAKEQYFGVDSTLEVSSDTTVHILLLQSSADLKFRVLSGGRPVYRAMVEVNGEQMLTNTLGLALFQNMARYVDHSFNISSEGLLPETGTVRLAGDTVLEISLVEQANGVSGHREGALRIYPIPAKSELHADSEIKISDMELYSLFGRLLQVQRVDGYHHAMDLSVMEPGIYIVRITMCDYPPVSLRIVLSR